MALLTLAPTAVLVWALLLLPLPLPTNQQSTQSVPLPLHEGNFDSMVVYNEAINVAVLLQRTVVSSVQEPGTGVG